MGFLSMLFGTRKLNRDPAQQTLAMLLIAGSQDFRARIDLTNFLAVSPWSAAETRNRIVHAVTLAKGLCDRETYAKVKALGLEMHNISYF